MYWGFQGKDMQEGTLRNRPIYKLANFLMLWPDFFYFTVDILISCKSKNQSKIRYDLQRIKKRLEILITTDNSIKEEQANEFYNFFCEYCQNEEASSGDLLNFIVYKVGPYKLNGDGINRKRECKIALKGNILTDKNFDVVFYRFYQNDFVQAELIECKIDLKAFVHSPPSDINSFSRKADEKLKAMRLIKEKEREKDSLRFYFATCRKNVISCQQMINDRGYDFVAIINGDELYEMVKRYKQQLI
ncbi:hypothetical protein [Thermosediminibacter litoriperuensis]|nr:hypothetical protein [Thermosediminibacter litoriperuensis]